MTEFDDVVAQIDRLHEEAEDLADLASSVALDDDREAARLRAAATRKVREAARLRAQIDE